MNENELHKLSGSGEYLEWYYINAETFRSAVDYRFKKWLKNECKDLWYYWWNDHSFESNNVEVDNFENIYFKSEEDKVKFILRWV